MLEKELEKKIKANTDERNCIFMRYIADT